MNIFARKQRILFDAVWCTYCGLYFDDRFQYEMQDHVVPRSVLTALKKINLRILELTVPCCARCNFKLGSQVFLSLGAKRNSIMRGSEWKRQKTDQEIFWENVNIVERSLLPPDSGQDSVRLPVEWLSTRQDVQKLSDFLLLLGTGRTIGNSIRSNTFIDEFLAWKNGNMEEFREIQKRGYKQRAETKKKVKLVMESYLPMKYIGGKTETRVCKTCDGVFRATRTWQLFCSVECRNKYHAAARISPRDKAIELEKQVKELTKKLSNTA